MYLVVLVACVGIQKKVHTRTGEIEQQVCRRLMGLNGGRNGLLSKVHWVMEGGAG
jgi:hypothetical protein